MPDHNKRCFINLISMMVLVANILAACLPEPLQTGDVAQSALERDTSPQVASADSQALVAGNNAFAFDFYQAARLEAGNQFYSPFSISLALAMAYAGARGQTAVQMADTLQFSLPPDRLHPAFNALDLDLAQRPEQAEGIEENQRFELSIVNAMWGQRDWLFLPEFLDLLAVNYNAGIRLVDFINAPETARQEINDWVSQQTRRRIENLIPPGLIDILTRLVLVNAIYFKAGWHFPFSESQTVDGPFTLLDGSQVNMPMMTHNDAKPFYYGQGDGYQAVTLPYKGGMAEMVILLPDAGRFEEFETTLNAVVFDQILAGMESKMVYLTLPKFEFTRDYDLGELLAAMGMPDAFDQLLADFSGINGQRDLYIRTVLHKAFISVDEAGTEAAAATAVLFTLMAMPGVDVYLKVDRPFIFIIRDVPTGQILFIGRLTSP